MLTESSPPLIAFYHDPNTILPRSGRPAMPVAMQLSRIIISEINNDQVIYLKEVDGDRTFPILIGFYEAKSIERRVKHDESPRPLTHDLLVATFEALGGGPQ